jgi:ParB family chromosome partitioning protein
VSEWLGILTLPEILQEKFEAGQITSCEAIKIAGRPAIHGRLVAAATKSRLEEEIIATGLKRGAPRGPIECTTRF